jgi:hypothetical protein
MRLTARQWDALAALWHELSEFPASEADVSLAHALRGLRWVIGGDRLLDSVREEEPAGP